MSNQTAAEKLDRLRAVLKPVIDWYEKTLVEGEPDDSYLYDVTCDQFEQKLSRGDYQEIIEILRTPAYTEREIAQSVQAAFAMDLWMAEGCPISEFDTYLQRNGIGDTWVNLLGVVRDAFCPKCGKPVDDDVCVLSEHTTGPCMGADDVGGFERPPHAQPIGRTELRVITSATELDTLPVGAVVMDSPYPEGEVYQRTVDGLWVEPGFHPSMSTRGMYLPVTVLWTPPAESENR